MQTRLYVERHPEVLSTLGNIGLTHYKMGRFATAVPQLERVVQLTREVLGPDHPGRVIDLNNYASLLRDQASLTVQEAVLDADHPDRALNLQGLGALARERGDFDRACTWLPVSRLPPSRFPLFREAVQQFERTHPTTHWQTLPARHWLGLYRAAQRKTAKTRRLLATTQAATDSAPGAAHPVAATVRARSEDVLQRRSAIRLDPAPEPAAHPIRACASGPARAR